jgi:hypothetical protein
LKESKLIDMNNKQITALFSATGIIVFSGLAVLVNELFEVKYPALLALPIILIGLYVGKYFGKQYLAKKNKA